MPLEWDSDHLLVHGLSMLYHCFRKVLARNSQVCHTVGRFAVSVKVTKYIAIVILHTHDCVGVYVSKPAIDLQPLTKRIFSVSPDLRSL